MHGPLNGKIICNLFADSTIRAQLVYALLYDIMKYWPSRTGVMYLEFRCPHTFVSYLIWGTEFIFTYDDFAGGRVGCKFWSRKKWLYVEWQDISHCCKFSCLGIQKENVSKLIRKSFFRFSCLPFKHPTDLLCSFRNSKYDKRNIYVYAPHIVCDIFCYDRI
jgi:hypothetical protein